MENLNQIRNDNDDHIKIIWIDKYHFDRQTQTKVNIFENTFDSQIVFQETNYELKIKVNKAHDECNIRLFGKEDHALDYIKKTKRLRFREIIIILAADIFDVFVDKLKNNLNDLYVIPRIIVYNREKNNFFNCRNSCLNCCKKKVDKFYRAGGEISSFQEVNNIIDGLQNPALENISSNDNKKLTSTFGNNSYLFEQIKGKRDLILPTFYKVLLNMAETKNNYEFIQKMYKSYQNSSDYKKLLTPILNIPDIPLELLSKFYARLYTIEGNFYKDMKNNLRNAQQNNTIYMPFIKTLYEGVERGALKMCIGKELYNASFLNEQELKDLKNYKDQRELDLPMAIIFSKAFLSFTKDKGIAEGFYSNGGKNTMLTIEAEKREYDLLTHADIEDLSYYTHEKEVLFFPFSAFGIQDFYYDDSKRRYEIKLIYLGKYIQKFEKDADFITSNA